MLNCVVCTSNPNLYSDEWDVNNQNRRLLTITTGMSMSTVQAKEKFVRLTSLS